MSHPLRKFQSWYDEAKSCETIHDASAMCLSTATRLGAPSSRMVLLKTIDQTGFVFFTNMNSRKSAELRENQNAALCFYWQPIGKQVRVEGYAERISDEEADIYFKTRARGSQLGAWASQQSEKLDHLSRLKDTYARLEKQYEGKDIPRPPHWSGWRVIPVRMEFWEEEPHRLHKREAFIRHADGWESFLLQP